MLSYVFTAEGEVEGCELEGEASGDEGRCWLCVCVCVFTYMSACVCVCDRVVSCVSAGDKKKVMKVVTWYKEKCDVICK